MKLKLVFLLALLIMTCDLFGNTQIIRGKHYQVSLMFEFIKTNHERILNKTGYAEYEGGVYRTNWNIPLCFLRSANLIMDGKLIELPTAGLADCIYEGQVMSSRLILLKPIGNNIKRLSIYFGKGGAEDFVANWIISSRSALFEFVQPCGDTSPEWYSEK